MSSDRFDCVVVGASFAGLACATSVARAGARVLILEKKPDVGARLHTTGILVKDVVDRIALLDGLPDAYVRKIGGVRLYAPNMSHIDLVAPGYYFLATDTPKLMRWLADKTMSVGAQIRYDTPFRGAMRVRGGFDIADVGNTRYLVGADGPRSRVASELRLGSNRQHLVGIEYEFDECEILDANRLHCFIDRNLAPGYIGWMVAGVGSVQIGLARRHRGAWYPHQAMRQFLEKIAGIVDFQQRKPTSVRAGLIPCGGLVSPVAASRALLIGDAAGMVSPVTAGGIHTALQHGLASGYAIADFLNGKADDPSTWFVNRYPQFRVKRALRWAFDHFQSDIAINLLLSTRPMRAVASRVYFHRKGVFDEQWQTKRPDTVRE
jgi:flavin-dependent dehydrogenase